MTKVVALKISLLGYVLLCMYSCTTYVQLSSSYKAETDILEGTSKILLLNGVDTKRLDFTSKDKITIYHDGALTVLAGVRYNIIRNNVEVISEFDRTAFVKKHLEHDMSFLSKDLLNKIATTYQVDYVLALEEYDLDLYKNKKASDFQKYTLGVKTKWIIYKTGREKYTIVDDYTEKSYPESYVSTQVFDLLGPSIVDNANLVQKTSNIAAEACVERLKPNKFLIKRLLYNSKDFKASSKAIQAKDYDKAKQLLEPLTMTTNNKIASKAYYNLAVLYEVQGDKTKALEYAHLSYSKSRNTYALLLLNSPIAIANTSP